MVIKVVKSISAQRRFFYYLCEMSKCENIFICKWISFHILTFHIVEETPSKLIYHISSYKALPRIIPAILIIPAFLIILFSENVVFSNKPRIWRLHKIMIPAGLIWGNTVYSQTVFWLICFEDLKNMTVLPSETKLPLKTIHTYQTTFDGIIKVLVPKYVLQFSKTRWPTLLRKCLP